MKINLSDYENLCKDKRQPIIVSQDRKSNCQHKAQNIVKQKFAQSVNGLPLHVGQDVTVSIHRNFD